LSFIKSGFIIKNKNNIYKRIISNELPGFSSHSPSSITNSIDKIVEKNGAFDIIYFATQLMAQVLLIKKWDSIHIVDFYDIYSLVIQNKLYQTKKTSPYYYIFLKELKQIENYERKIINQADLLIAISDYDRASIIRNTRKKCLTVQNGVRFPESNWKISDRKSSIIMVGNFHYSPNIEGLKWFINKVWPIINVYNKDIVFHVIGKHPLGIETITQNYGNIIWMGEIENLDEVYVNAGCAIVPIRQGGGIKYKVLEAMAYGIPVISTKFGVKGIKHNGSVITNDSYRKFAKSIIMAIENPQRHRIMSNIGRKIIRNTYSWAKQIKILENEIRN
jgi:glycosyltransferase involved in cell wall biosynthesis